MVSIGPTIGIKGESSYRSALRNIISETKVLNSEMDLMVAKFKSYDSTIEKNTKKQEMLNRQLDASRQALIGYQDQQERAKTRVDELRQKQEEAIKAYEKATSAQVQNTKEVQEAEIQMNKTSDAVQNAERTYNEWSDKVNKAELEVVKLENALKELPNNLEIIGSKMTEVGDTISGVGDAMMKYITAPITAAGTAFVKWSSDFTDGMAKIYTIANESEKPMAEMRQELIELSNQSGYSLEDLAEAEYQAVSASVATGDAVDFLTDATRLARAGFTSTTQSVDLLTTVINAYGLEAKDAKKISDVLLRTQNDGKTVIDELAWSMGTVIPTAANYNVSLEQLAAAYATMTKQGVNTSRATTFLNAMFTELEKESSSISKILEEETGKSFAQLMGEGKTLADVLKILYESVGEDNEQFQRLFGNIRSGKAAAALLTDDFGILNYETLRMATATGQTAEALEVLETPSLKAQRAIQQLKNSGMELGTELINELYPAFQAVIDGVKSFTDWFAKLDSSTKKTIAQFTLFAAGSGVVVKAVGTGISAIGKMVEGTGKLSKNMMELSLKFAETNPKLAEFLFDAGAAAPKILGVGAAITVAVAAFAGLAVATEAAMEADREAILAEWGMGDAMRENIEASKQLATAYAEKKLAIQEDKATTIGQVETAKALVEEYNSLVDANGQIAEGDKELANVIQSELAMALGLELADVQSLVEENGKYGASIEDTMNKILQRAELAAYEQLYTEAIKRKTEAEQMYDEQLKAAEEQHQKVLEAQQLVTQATNDLKDAQARGESNIGSYKNALDNAVNALGQATAEEQRLYDAVSDTKQNVESATQDANVAANKIREVTGKTMGEIQQKIITGGASVARAADSVAGDVERNLTVDGDNLGYNIVAGLSGGIRRYSYMAAQSAASMASQAAAAARYALSVESPSKVMAEVGKYFDLGFAVGIEGNLRDVTQAATMMANAAVGGVQTVGYEPNQNNYTKTISAPISINLTVNGNVDNEQGFARSLAEDLVNLINRDREVFA